MDFEYNETQILLRDSAQKFLREEYPFEKRRAPISATCLDTWRQLASMGWLGTRICDSHGGMNLSLADACVLSEELGRGLVREPVLEVALLAGGLLSNTDHEMVEGLLDGLLSGESLVCLATTEPGDQHFCADPKTTASRSGSGLKLTGSKVLVRGGDAADHLIVSCILEDKLALVVVPTEANGLNRKSYRLLDGSIAADFEFSDVDLPESQLFAHGESAVVALQRCYDEAALLVAAESIGLMTAVIELTNDYLHDRQQFGKPLAHFQALQHRLAEMYIELEMARSVLYYAISCTDQHASTFATAVSVAKSRIDQAADFVGNQGIHLHGGMGMTMEYPVGHYYRRLLMLSQSFGNADFHLARYEATEIAA